MIIVFNVHEQVKMLQIPGVRYHGRQRSASVSTSYHESINDANLSQVRSKAKRRLSRAVLDENSLDRKQASHSVLAPIPFSFNEEERQRAGHIDQRATLIRQRRKSVAEQHPWLRLLDKPPDERTTADVEQIIKLLNELNVAFLKHLPKSVLEECSKHFRYGVFEGPDELIFAAGDPGESFYVILEGSVRIVLGVSEVQRKLAERIEHSEGFSALDHEDHGILRGFDMKLDAASVGRRQTMRAGEVLLMAGAGFGEVALSMPISVRTASAYAASPFVLLLILDRDTYQAAIQEKSTAKIQRKMDYISSHSFFSRLNLEKRSSLRYALKERSFKRGGIVFKEGQPGTSVFFCHTGEVALYQNWANRKQSELARVSSPNGYFAEEYACGLLQAPNRANTAVALEACILFEISNSAFTKNLQPFLHEIRSMCLQKTELRSNRLLLRTDNTSDTASNQSLLSTSRNMRLLRLAPPRQLGELPITYRFHDNHSALPISLSPRLRKLHIPFRSSSFNMRALTERASTFGFGSRRLHDKETASEQSTSRSEPQLSMSPIESSLHVDFGTFRTPLLTARQSFRAVSNNSPDIDTLLHHADRNTSGSSPIYSRGHASPSHLSYLLNKSPRMHRSSAILSETALSDIKRLAATGALQTAEIVELAKRLQQMPLL